jgi:hypothetical protein
MTDSINNPYVCKSLKKSLIIGKGGRRIVYRHPDNPNQCLKIVHHKMVHYKYIDENKGDIKYYQHLQNRGASFKHIACIRGEQNTNKGNALVFDLIKDYDGEISKTLRYYLLTPPIQSINCRTPAHFKTIFINRKNCV